MTQSYYQKNKAARLEYQKAYYRRNHTIVKPRNRQYYWDTKGKVEVIELPAPRPEDWYLGCLWDIGQGISMLTKPIEEQDKFWSEFKNRVWRSYLLQYPETDLECMRDIKASEKYMFASSILCKGQFAVGTHNDD